MRRLGHGLDHPAPDEVQEVSAGSDRLCLPCRDDSAAHPAIPRSVSRSEHRIWSATDADGPLSRAVTSSDVALCFWLRRGLTLPTPPSSNGCKRRGRTRKQLGVSRATFDAATRGLEPDLFAARSRLPGRPETAAAAAGIRADAGAISARADLRPPGRAGQETRRAIPRHAGAHRERVRRARQCGAGDLGARDRLRRRKAAARRHPRAGDASLCRQAQGFLPQRIPARAEDAAGRRAARRHALVLGRRHGPHAIPAVGVLQIRRRFRRRRPRRHLAFGAGCARLGGQAARRQGLAGRQAVGDRGARAGQRSIAPSPSRASPCRSREWLKRGYRADLRAQADRRGTCRRGLAAAAGRHLRAGLPHAEKLLRAQGLQLFRSLRAVRRPSERPHRRRPAVPDAVEQERAAQDQRRSRRCSSG